MIQALLTSVSPRPAEVAAALPGDDIVPTPDVVMDRAFDLPAPPEAVWPWFVQVGKGRAGWYLPRKVEAVLPRRGRAFRHLDPKLLDLQIGEVIGDWGGKHATLELVTKQEPNLLVHRSTRGRMHLSWAIMIAPAAGGSRVHIRLRLGPVRHRRLVSALGEALDLLTIAGLAAGLKERLVRARNLT